MEAVPRLSMVSFELRQSGEPADFGPKLKQFIKIHYNEDPDTFGNEISQLEGLRSSAVRPIKDVTGCSTMKRYYCQLHFLSSRFPMHKDGEAAVKFTWKHLSNNSNCSSNDVSLEKSSVLYNIGALHSQLGAMDNRTTAEGMKMSCTHFQCAAWAFQHVIEEYAQSAGLDLSLDLMSFMNKLCLAQAQECILEKSMMDNRKASIIAKVSVQTVEYYKQALKVITDSDDANFSEQGGSKQIKKWEKYLKFKISYHGSIALLFQGQQAEEQQKMGERFAYYQASFDKLDEARKLSKGLDNMEAVNEALTFVHDVVEGKRKIAKNENDFIYHEEIPDINVLPDVKGASLVKGIPFNVNDIEVSGPDIFKRIVPMKAHESSSLYSEEKAKLLRKVVGMIENKDEELETFLSTLQLDELNKVDGNQLPQDLIDRCAALSAKPDAIPNLVESMNKLSSIYHDVEAMLTEIKELLSEEEIHEKEYQETVGKRPPTIAATDLTREAKKYQEAHLTASESNQTLHKAMKMHISNMKLLSLPPKELLNQIPPVVESPKVEAVANEMRHLVDKVNEMKQQRLLLSQRIRESIYQDDILRQVVTFSGENIQALFDSELQKHQRIVSLIEQNLAAQDNILKAVKETYAKYGTTRKETSEMHRRREGMISSLIASYDAYEDLLAKTSKGLHFYKKLETNVSKLLQRVKGTCKVQDEEREQIIKNVKNSESQDPAPNNTPKLKDYLEMKKEFGKLSLDNIPVPPSNPYYKMNEQVPNQSWIPGVRPAPVGSEETNSLSKTDTMTGAYPSMVRDSSWNNAPYPNNQIVDDRGKYYVPQAEVPRNFPTDTNSQSLPQDIYPISAYSSVMQNTSTTGYTGPKSNYYNTQNSPSRYINPPHFYTDYNQPVVSDFGAVSMPNSNQTPMSNDPAVYPGYNYPNPQPVNYYPPTCYPELPGNYSQNYQYSQVPNYSKPAVETGQTQISYPTETDPFSNSAAVTQQRYGQYINNYVSDKGVMNYGQQCSYTTPVQYSTPQSYQKTEPSYVQPTDQNYYTVEGTAAYSDYPQVQQSFEELPKPAANYPNEYVQPGYDPSSYNANTWQPQQYDPNAYPSTPTQQSGNESLYTACQNNNYSLTNSEMYKNVETGYGNQTYQNQYYVNQYGTCNGQNEYGLNYGNSATYIQAGADKQQATTTTTYSNSDAKSSPSTEHSNVDLLAGLDFSINQSPLVPETTSQTQKTETVKKEKKEEGEVAAKTEKVEEPQDATPTKDPFLDLEKLNQDVEKYEKFVESLTLKTLNGPTCLDLKWKEISELQDKSSHFHIISVARCYPMKNRFPDILPYDDSRVELPSTKDDYINASFMRNLTPLTPNMILTQAPLPSTYTDFWAMVFEQQVEVIVCLLSESELDRHIYWPCEKGQELEMGKLKITLQSSNVKPHWIERIMSITVTETRVTRVVIHMQFTSWPGSSFPDSPGPFLSFATECINFFSQQRSSSHPVVVHCISGVGRTGLFCVTVAAILDIQSGKGIPDLVAITGRMCQCRKSGLRDREHLKFAYQAVLYYCQDFLMKRGILTNRSAFDDKKLKEGKCHTRHPSEDFLLGPPTDLNQLQSGIEKMGFDCPGSNKLETDPEKSPSAGTQRGSIANTYNSSGRSSPSSLTPDVLSTLDPTNFNLKLDPGLPRKSSKQRYTIESFGKKSESSLNAFNTDSDDPLSRLDPLWTMKK